ncbi:hypothetical protein N7450_001661 [Penicillium hetheringtonii]|uniref:Transcriptional activator of proteases prtT n=1 Tax=Penicillium hetheringtonii TaxID=911720 RepID=A0AAD6E513_9EURO|nr:hypothetical protein N7450_001661 [Penicillium hetheringtonii]
MPPLRLGRASKACDSCRKNKTRCYAKAGVGNTCLRCHTLSLSCSLEFEVLEDHLPHLTSRQLNGGKSPKHSNPDQRSSTDARYAPNVRLGGLAIVDSDIRLDKLERTVSALVDRLDSQSKLPGNRTSTHAPSKTSESRILADSAPAPVILIRDVATDAGVSSPNQLDIHSNMLGDVISAGLVTLPTAYSLLRLFRFHYGRWVRFSEDVATEVLLSQVRKSPLLLCSVFLIAVRHTTQGLADELAPSLFREAKNLISKALLVTPQPIEYFQATLILSLWSTTIGQQPLSIDSWLLTGYALQQGFKRHKPTHGVSGIIYVLPIYSKAHGVPYIPFLTSFLILINRYCVGTRRQTMLSQEHVDKCQIPLGNGSFKNYEARMVAEVKLYWVIYTKCCPQDQQVDLSDAKLSLQDWKEDWKNLFGVLYHRIILNLCPITSINMILDEPRSQFLQMGFHFAHLLAYYQSARSPQALLDGSIILEMIEVSSNIINLAIDTTDDRTRHLTDHIYHTVTFSALTLCRLTHTYDEQLRVSDVNVDELDRLIMKLITWLRTIGLPCHAAHLLSDVVSSQFQKLRLKGQPIPTNSGNEYLQDRLDYTALASLGNSPLSSNVGFLYPELICSELFDLDDGASSWPQWS